MYREENVDNAENLTKILNTFNFLVGKHNYPFVVSSHTGTPKRLEFIKEEDSSVELHQLVRYMKSFGFNVYKALQKHSFCAISDSGFISKESSIIGFPAISLRQSMVRPEEQDEGSIILTGFDPSTIILSIEISVSYFNGCYPLCQVA